MKIKLTLLIIILLSGYLLYINYTKPDSLIHTKPTVMQEFEWNIIEPDSKFNWQKNNVTAMSSKDNSNIIFLERRNSSNWDEKYLDLPFSGQVYETTLQDQDPNYDALLEYVRNGYESEYSKNGWKSSLDFGDWFITGMAADGVFGSSSGLVKLNGSKIKTVITRYNITVTDWEGHGSEIICPCPLNAKIFISDKLDLNEELPHQLQK